MQCIVEIVSVWRKESIHKAFFYFLLKCLWIVYAVYIGHEMEKAFLQVLEVSKSRLPKTNKHSLLKLFNLKIKLNNKTFTVQGGKSIDYSFFNIFEIWSLVSVNM